MAEPRRIEFSTGSLLVGAVLGVVWTLAVWYGFTLSGRAEITRQLLESAKCDAIGFVSITFTDGSQFTCAPSQPAYPTKPKRGG